MRSVTELPSPPLSTATRPSTTTSARTRRSPSALRSRPGGTSTVPPVRIFSPRKLSHFLDTGHLIKIRIVRNPRKYRDMLVVLAFSRFEPAMNERVAFDTVTHWCRMLRRASDTLGALWNLRWERLPLAAGDYPARIASSTVFHRSPI